jgi:hypothetical protein
VNSCIVAQPETVNFILVLIVSCSIAISVPQLPSPRKFFSITNHHIQYLATMFSSWSEPRSQFCSGACRFVPTDDQNGWDERVQNFSPNFRVL